MIHLSNFICCAPVCAQAKKGGEGRECRHGPSGTGREDQASTKQIFLFVGMIC